MIKSRILLSLLFLSLASFAFAQQVHHKVIKLMGSRFEISAVHEDAELAWKGINAGITEIERIESLISSWDPNSQTSEINRQAGIAPVKVDKELYDLIYRSIKVSDLTRGAFDISFAAGERLWNFDGSESLMPPAEKVAATVKKINYKNIILDSKQQTVFLKEKGMRIGFGAIGKGYAANKAKVVMEDIGIRNGVVNASGDLICWGRQLDGTSWGVAIADPKNIKKAAAWLTVEDGAIVTSGNYEKYTMIDGQRHAHIIDPRTGYPTTGIKSVSIICPDPELADALATSVFVLGKEEGLALINQLKKIECLIIDDEDRMIASKNLMLDAVE